MDHPLAYLLTWTTYGTWLHGDVRGSVDRDHRRPGQQFAPPSVNRQHVHLSRLKHAPVRLDDAMRRLVHATIARHCEIRRWDLRALNVRTNHVHVVVGAGQLPDVVMSQFKAWRTRRLRENRCIGESDDPWTEGGSTRYLWDEAAARAAVEYVMEQQGKDLQ